MSRVLVTGAASGLGEALTRAFRERGDEVLATDLASVVDVVSTDGSQARLLDPHLAERASKPLDPQAGGFEALASSGTSTTELFPLDITSDDDWAAALAHVTDTWGGLDILVNNAGVAGGGRIELCTMDEWRWITEINLFGVVRGTRTFVPMLKQQRSGHIVNIASLAGLVHPAGMGSYNAVKAAVVAFTETAGHELASYGVKAHAVCPSYFRTNLIDSMQGSDEKVGQIIGRLVDRSPISADDIAAAVLAGIEAGDDVIVPDEPARTAYFIKWADRPGYDAMMRKQAQSLEQA